MNKLIRLDQTPRLPGRALSPGAPISDGSASRPYPSPSDPSPGRALSPRAPVSDGSASRPYPSSSAPSPGRALSPRAPRPGSPTPPIRPPSDFVIVPLSELQAARPFRQPGYLEVCLACGTLDQGTGLVTFKLSDARRIRRAFRLPKKGSGTAIKKPCFNC